MCLKELIFWLSDNTILETTLQNLSQNILLLCNKLSHLQYYQLSWNLLAWCEGIISDMRESVGQMPLLLWKDDKNIIQHERLELNTINEKGYLLSLHYSHIVSHISKSSASLLSSLFLVSILSCCCSASFWNCPFLTSSLVISTCSFLSSFSRWLNFDVSWNYTQLIIILFTRHKYKIWYSIVK